MHRTTLSHLVRTGVLAVALALSAAAASAQQAPSAAKLQLGREIVEASGATKAFDGMIPSILQQALNSFVQQNPDLQKELLASVQAVAADYEKRKEEIFDILAGVYAARFTETEMKEILNFYRSNTGKKFVVQMPLVLEEGFAKTQEWGAKLSGEIVNRVRADMKKKGHTI